MSYELLIFTFLLMLFWSFMTIFTVKVMFCLFNSVRPEGAKEIKLPSFMAKKAKRPTEEEKRAAEERRQYDIIMRNIEAYDGTGIGQEEVI